MTSEKQIKRILVAGAEGALGQAAVAFFLARGLKVVSSCRQEGDLARIQGPGVESYVCDLSKDLEVRGLIEQAEKAGPVDALFNAAGAFRYGAVTELSVEESALLFAANFQSAYLLARHLVPRMRERSLGRLVFVSAKGTLGLGEAGMGIYTASKAALNHLVLGLSQELKGSGVTVNAVLPTIIDTPQNRQAMPRADTAKWVARESLLAVVLALMAGKDLNGALLPVAGGL